MQNKGLSGYWLKVIAVITMLIDHVGASVLRRMLVQLPAWGPIDNANWDQWYRLYEILRALAAWRFRFIAFFWWRDLPTPEIRQSTPCGCLSLR